MRRQLQPPNHYCQITSDHGVDHFIPFTACLLTSPVQRPASMDPVPCRGGSCVPSLVPAPCAQWGTFLRRRAGRGARPGPASHAEGQPGQHTAGRATPRGKNGELRPTGRHAWPGLQCAAPMSGERAGQREGAPCWRPLSGPGVE